MAISPRAIGAPSSASSTSAIFVATPAGYTWQSGDRSFLFGFSKPHTATISAGLSGWTHLGTFTGGAGTAANDVGEMAVHIYYRDDDPGAGPTINFSASGSHSAIIHVFKADSGWADVPTPTSGSDTTDVGGAYSAAGSTNLNLDPGDVCLAVHAGPTDAGTVRPETLTASGATLLGRSVLSDLAATAGTDHRARVMCADVFSGSSSAGPVHEYTMNVATSSGVTAFIRLRENTPEVPDFATEIMADSPLIWWRLNGMALDENDSSGNGNHAQNITSVTRGQTGVSSRLFEAVVPTGTATAGGTVPDSGTLDVADVTMVVVAKTTPTGAFQWFGGKYGVSGGNQSIALRMNTSDQLQIMFRVDSDVNPTGYEYTGSIDFADDNWHIFHVTWGSGTDTLTLYIDGVEAQTWSVPGTSMYVGTGAVFFGSREPGGDMVDAIDEFAFFGTELSGARISAHSVALGFSDPNLVQGGFASETDSVLAGVSHITISGELSEETDSTISGSISQTVVGGFATESDESLAGFTSIIVVGNLIDETDEALTGSLLISFLINGGQSSESDEALAGSVEEGLSVITGDQTQETDQALSGTVEGTYISGTAVEADTAFTGFTYQPYVGSQATETDTALTGNVLSPVVYSGGQASEADTTFAGEVFFSVTSTIEASGEGNAQIWPVVIATVERNRVGGRYRTGVAVATWEPEIVPPPYVGTRKMVIAQQFFPPVIEGTQPVYTPTFKKEIEYRTRILVDGWDVSWFRGVATPIPSFEMGEPLGWGVATLSFPQIIPTYEKIGIGDLRWLRPGSRVKLQRVNDDTNEIIRTDYIGVVVGLNVNGGELTCDVGGQLTGRATLRDKQPPLVQRREDIGEVVADRIRLLGLSHRPPLGRNTDIKIQRFGGQSDLEHLQEAISLAVNNDGDQWTVMPNDKGIYHTYLKDYDTIDGTAYCDDTRVVADLKRDIAEEPNRVYASGITKEGMIIKFGAYPGLLKSRQSPYPFNDGRSFGQGTDNEDTDTGDGIGVMIWRLIAMGYMDYRVPVGTYDSEVTEAIEDLQRDVDLPVTGNMNKKTWAALYDISATGYSLRKSVILPAAQTSKTRKWRRTASGSVLARNPNYDKHTLVVDRTVEMGNGIKKRQMRRWAKRTLSHGDNWIGTITIHTGAIVAGEHEPGMPIDEILRARDIRPGMNIWLPLFDGGTLVHVSGVSVAEDDGPVTLIVDTKARDVMEAWEVIQRNRDSRQTPMRSFLRQRRASQMSKDRITYDEVGGIIDDAVACEADSWTVFPVVASQAGSIQRLRIELGNPCEFAMAVFGKRIRPRKLRDMVGNPLLREAKTRWDNETVRRKLENDYVMLYAAGSNDDPCGYYPKNKSENPNADVTGIWKDDAGFDYVSFHNESDPGSVLWVAVWTEQNTKIVPGRIMWPLSEEY